MTRNTSYTPGRFCPECGGALRLTDSGKKFFHAYARPEDCPVFIWPEDVLVRIPSFVTAVREALS